MSSSVTAEGGGRSAGAGGLARFEWHGPRNILIILVTCSKLVNRVVSESVSLKSHKCVIVIGGGKTLSCLWGEFFSEKFQGFLRIPASQLARITTCLFSPVRLKPRGEGDSVQVAWPCDGCPRLSLLFSPAPVFFLFMLLCVIEIVHLEI